MKNLILIGAGGHCLSCIDIIENIRKYKIKGIFDRNKDINIEYPILGNDNDLERFKKKYNYAFITIGQIKSPNLRIRIFSKIKKIGYKIPIIISKNAYVSKSSKVEEGTIIMNYAICNAYSSIGKNCIINNGAIVEHGVQIGNNCHISTGSVINGDCKIGSGTFIGSKVVVKEGVVIGKNCLIGAGAILKKNLSNNQIYK